VEDLGSWKEKVRVKLNLRDLWGLTIAVGLPAKLLSKWVCLCCASGR
jgi:hypothetical protein